MDNMIQSPLLESFIRQYQRDLNGETHKHLFAIPEVLQGIVQVIFLHSQKKSILYKSIPKDTIFVDNVDECLERINSIIRQETRGFFTTVDPITERNMRRLEFRSAVIAFFYLEGLWVANLNNKRPFYNQNGTIKRDVSYFGFNKTRVVVADGILTAHVDYIASHNRTIQDKVCFSMPVGSTYRDGVYEKCMLIVPNVDVQYKQSNSDGLNTNVINFRYLHNMRGFKAVGMYSGDAADYAYENRHVFVLDKPFKIKIFYKDENVLQVLVENL